MRLGSRRRAACPQQRQGVADHLSLAEITVWPIEPTSQPLAGEVPSARDFGYQQELMDWLDRVWSTLEEAELGHSFLGRNGASLLEIARYHFFFDFAHLEQRWRALCEMRHQGASERVVWVAPAEHRQHLSALKAAWPAPLELVRSTQSANLSRRLWRRAKLLARSAIDGVAARALRWKRSAIRPPTSDKGRVVFAEYFASSAKVLMPVASILRDQHGLEVLWLAARRQVRERLMTLGVDSLLLGNVAPRACGSENHLSMHLRGRIRDALQRLPDDLFCGTADRMGRNYLLPAMRELLINSLNEAAYWLDAITEALEHLRPDCVVSTTYTSLVGRAVTAARRALGMPFPV